MFKVTVIGGFLTIINVAYGIGNSSDINLTGCRNLTTNDYAYTFYPIEEIKNDTGIFIKFNVRAGRGAFILFSSANEPPKWGHHFFEVAIGAEEETFFNARTIPIREYSSRNKVENVALSEKWRQFWVQIISDGSLFELRQIGKQRGITVDAMTSKLIRYYGFASTSDKNIVDWAFLCPEVSD